jgi:hypothetical protein
VEVIQPLWVAVLAVAAFAKPLLDVDRGGGTTEPRLTALRQAERLLEPPVEIIDSNAIYAWRADSGCSYVH